MQSHGGGGTVGTDCGSAGGVLFLACLAHGHLGLTGRIFSAGMRVLWSVITAFVVPYLPPLGENNHLLSMTRIASLAASNRSRPNKRRR